MIYFCVESSKLPGDYNLSYARDPTGVTLFHVDYVLIADLTVQGFQLDGINLQNSARDVTIVDVTCRGNGRSGIAVGGASLVDDPSVAVGQQWQGSIAHVAIRRDTHPRLLLALQHRPRLGRSGWPRVPRR